MGIRRTGVVHDANQITEGVIWRQILYFFFPILFGTFFQQLYNTADAIIVGRFVGTEALAAVGGPTGTLIGFIVNLFVGIAAGTTVITAQSYGAHNEEAVEKTVHTSFALSVIVGFALTILGIVLAPWALGAMDTPADIMAPSVLYLRVFMLGTIPSFLYNVGSGVLRAVGDTKRPLYFLVISCLVNIVLDILFVAMVGMGVFGAALATVLSQLVSAVLVVLSLMRAPRMYHLDWKQVKFHGKLTCEVLRVGIPTALQSNMYTIANLLIQVAVNGFGTSTIAASTAFSKIDAFYWMVLAAYGISITTFTGQNFGAHKYDRIRKGVHVCLWMSLVTSFIISGLFYLSAPYLLGIFTADQEVLHLGLEIMSYMTPYYFTYVCVEIISGAARGCGSSLVSTLMTCGGVCASRILWVFFVLPQHHSLHTLMIIYPISWALTSVLFIIYYFEGSWLRGPIKRLGYPPEVRKHKHRSAEN